ncbi:MAG: Methylated-DNA--protein-cysteine methyltransferase [Clostridiales bacterium 38_11]|nr:MAG: Methylated-DNA--protein-cysteine methyltransferase [Clostridiales bacterium 38_11]HBH11579.1 cysteine methyltransferase [Clostridiales bacterium]
MYNRYIETPLGLIRIKASDRGLTEISFRQKNEEEQRFNKHVDVAAKQLMEYFAGLRQEFQLTYDIIGTDFRMKVWHELQKISYGSTISYKELAIRVGNPKAVRAVGGANHWNPLGIVIPCHRVIGADGSLVGYAEGIDKKKWLLDLENRNTKQ